MSQEIFLEDLVQRSNKPATKNDWKIYPIKDPKIVEANLQLSEEDYQKLIKGFLPSQMEDKWFVFFDDGFLNFHRSWTGYGIFRAEILKEGDHYLIGQIFVESSFGESEYCKQTFLRVVKNILLSSR